jgi:hypothetical protein
MHDRVLHDQVIHDQVIHDQVIHDQVIHDQVIHDRVLRSGQCGGGGSARGGGGGSAQRQPTRPPQRRPAGIRADLDASQLQKQGEARPGNESCRIRPQHTVSAGQVLDCLLHYGGNKVAVGVG